MLSLAVNNDSVALAAKRARSLPDLFHQHAGSVILRDADAFADEPFFIFIRRPEGRDDNNVVAGQGIPEQRSRLTGRGRLAINGERHTLVCLQVTQAALEE